ncbi:hypothetical protein GGR57DRAFT_319051 [Xylariaceae sp. FL1272]|nr:hypothetical protein GGR57DRAFT_319051 [Xylariaceae sp. FL1272]
MLEYVTCLISCVFVLLYYISDMLFVQRREAALSRYMSCLLQCQVCGIWVLYMCISTVLLRVMSPISRYIQQNRIIGC